MENVKLSVVVPKCSCYLSGKGVSGAIGSVNNSRKCFHCLLSEDISKCHTTVVPKYIEIGSVNSQCCLHVFETKRSKTK